MSADNGVYILESIDGFRVTEAQAIDNLWWWWDDPRLYDEEFVKAQEARGIENPYAGSGRAYDQLNPKELLKYFGKCKVFKTREEALDEANRIYEEIMSDDFCPVCEYGIQFIHGWENKDFPSA